MKKPKNDFNSPQPFNFQGTPKKGSGIRFIDTKEAIELCNDPEMRKALNVIQKQSAIDFPELFANKPLGVKKAFMKQCQKDIYADMHAMINKKIIDRSEKKQ